MDTGYRIIYFLLIGIFQSVSFAHAQDEPYKNKVARTSEKIASYKLEFPLVKGEGLFVPIGHIKQSILYLLKDKNHALKFFILNEGNYSFQRVFNNINLDGKNLYHFAVQDSLLFYTKTFHDEKDGYSQLILNYKNRTLVLDSVYNSDKKINPNFSADNNLLIINCLNTLSDYYNPAQDNRFRIFALNNLQKGPPTARDIPCTHCAKGSLIENKFFFTKSTYRDDFNDGYAWMDIYYSPWGKMQDSTKIASYSDIVQVSPDGKYILARRIFDLKNRPFAIIDVRNKKYQLLLGRDYSNGRPFYSFKEKKFAFDFGGVITYIDYPKEFPFDALKKTNRKDIPSWTDLNFYKQFEHKPFTN
jgi:hypothetical protein